MPTKLERSTEALKATEGEGNYTFTRSRRYRESMPSYRSISDGGVPGASLHLHKWIFYPTPGNRLCVKCGEVQERGMEGGDPMGKETWTTVGYVNPDVESVLNIRNADIAVFRCPHCGVIVPIDNYCNNCGTAQYKK